MPCWLTSHFMGFDGKHRPAYSTPAESLVDETHGIKWGKKGVLQTVINAILLSTQTEMNESIIK